MLSRVPHHHGEGVLAGLLAKVGEYRNVAADDRLQARAESPEDRPGSHDDAAHHTDITDDPIAGQLKGCGHHGGIESDAEIRWRQR